MDIQAAINPPASPPESSHAADAAENALRDARVEVLVQDRPEARQNNGPEANHVQVNNAGCEAGVKLQEQPFASLKDTACGKRHHGDSQGPGSNQRPTPHDAADNSNKSCGRHDLRQITGTELERGRCRPWQLFRRPDEPSSDPPRPWPFEFLCLGASSGIQVRFSPTISGC